VQFLYPADVLKPTQPDEMYGPEVAATRAAGFAVSTFPLELLVSGRAKISPAVPGGETVVYRGWMLSAEEYLGLSALITQSGAEQLTSPEKYLLTHHLPNWYPLLKEFTPETEIVSVDADLEQVLRGLGWGRFFIKDYVKSLKTSVGSIIERPEQVALVVREMQKFRGKIEGGLCIRRVEDFLPETERRFFVIDGQPYAAESHADIPAAVHACAERIRSSFFSVDVVSRDDGIDRIVEIGDGQVSDLVGWEAQRFAQVWQGQAHKLEPRA
jgi:hypothetical protein